MFSKSSFVYFKVKTHVDYLFYLHFLNNFDFFRPLNGRIAETFWTTPLTSTYLLAFIVSHYVVVASNNDTVRPFDIYARDNAGTTGDWSLEIGELLLDAMERYTQIPYFTMAENINMKQAAIPDFSAGAMENWGLLTYRYVKKQFFVTCKVFL